MVKKSVCFLVSIVMIVAIMLACIGCSPSTPATSTSPATSAPTAAAPQVIKWKMASHLGVTTPQFVKAVPAMIEKIKKATNGRLQIELYATGALMPSGEVLDGASKGTIDYGRTWAGYHGNLNAAYDCFAGLPYAIPTYEDNLYLVKKAGWEDIARKVMDKKGITLVNLSPCSNYGEMCSKKKIQTIDDFKGMKIRGYGVFNQLFDKLGAKGVSLATGEAYSALQTGVLDGIISGTASNMLPMGYPEVAKYWITPPMVGGGGLTNMDFANPKSWAALPDDFKAIVTWASQECLTEYFVNAAYEDAVALQTMITKHKNEVIKLSDAEVAKLRAIAMELWDTTAAKSPEAADAVKVMKDFMKLKGYLQ